MQDAPTWLLVERLSVDSAGETFFESCRIPNMGIMPSVSGRNCIFSSVPLAVDHVSVRIIPEGTDIHHNAPERRLVAILSGTMEVTASNGHSRKWSGGELMLATDTGQGKGHRTRAVGGDVLTVVAALPTDLDLDSWAT